MAAYGSGNLGEARVYALRGLAEMPNVKWFAMTLYLLARCMLVALREGGAPVGKESRNP
jgi:hypothetical protein